MKLNSLAFLFSLFFLFACQNKPEKAPADENQNIKTAELVFKHFNQHEWEKMAALYSDSADFKDPSLGPDVVKQSRAQTAEKYRAMHKMFPDIRVEVTAVYPSGDKNVIVEFVSSGSAPDGTKWSLPICTIFTIDNGVITKDYTYYDTQQ